MKARKVQFAVTESQKDSIVRKLQYDTDWLKKEQLMDLMNFVDEGYQGPIVPMRVAEANCISD